MESGLISVIIPVYNTEKYLVECLDSVLAQTYTNYEAILVDDGSTDQSPAICDEYADRDPRFRVIHRENGGLSEARNTGLDVARGKYIYFLDSDDRLVPNTLEYAFNKLFETGADFVFFDGQSFEDSPRGFGIEQRYIRKTEYAPLEGIRMLDLLQKNDDLHFAVQMYLYRASFLFQNAFRFYPGLLYEDMVFSFEAFCRAEKVAHCHKPLYERRFRSGSIVTSKPSIKNFESMLTVYHEVTRIANETGFSVYTCVKNYKSRCAFRVFDLYSKIPSKEKEQKWFAYQEFVSEIRKTKGNGDRALFYRSFGKLPWATFRAVQKVFKR